MGYTFKNLCIRNFKYITSNKPLKFDFMSSNIVILDGQNGYGKTTLFDAIEILVTGKIKHFNPSLQNRKTETLGTLANDINKDIVISAILSSDVSDEIYVERKLLCKNEFQSIITLNNQEISQEELYDKLHLSSNMFDIGTYISQSESLDFLQNKYKNRKDSVSSLLDDTEITDKIQVLKSVQESIMGRVEKEIGDKEKQIDEIGKKVNEIKRQAEHIVLNAELPGENIRLFDEAEYKFDVIKLEQGIAYETVVQQLKQIEGFIENYDEYIRYKNNAIIRELKESPKQLYMALFYQQEIELLKKKESLIKALNKSKELLMDYTNNVWSVDETLFNKIKIKPEIVTQIKTSLLNQKKEQSQLDDADKVLAQMTKARRGLIKEFYNAAESGKFNKSKCPLCGTEFADIDAAITETEQFIKNIHTDGIKIIEDLETQITNLFQKEIIPVLKAFLEENRVLIKMDDTLSGCKNLSVEKLQQLLNKVKIPEFKSQEIKKFDIEEFSQQYENLLKELQEKEVPNKIIFQEKQIELYKSIHNTYYHNEKPYHTVKELQSKEQYVAKLFNDNFSIRLSTEETRLKKLKDNYEEYKKKTDSMTDAVKTLISKYEDANKEYQTQLLNAIKIPLMVYSGRIIQNYPLGLGIRAIIKTNQLVFEAVSKSGSDVYNILSTGQLNGLSIAFLLSIKNVYGDTKGLDILLIDDPLQTIDDISAISLADLLTQQGIGQIVLSTHEEAKAALLRYKFKRAGMRVLEQNMRELYMKTVTED
ncbi:AAA family ATPase [Enterocloster citroniae]|uniref:AAA family ATPase n=1 Tax=Enterocloster citroniae TaxID=358743 RepID=UPI001D092C83|nr:AAA family ATPase [Enterocloster citroniae]MCB7064789.1 AAA family ATPase [Enterocloster citroniae]